MISTAAQTLDSRPYTRCPDQQMAPAECVLDPCITADFLNMWSTAAPYGVKISGNLVSHIFQIQINATHISTYTKATILRLHQDTP